MGLLDVNCDFEDNVTVVDYTTALTSYMINADDLRSDLIDIFNQNESNVIKYIITGLF